MAKYGEMLRVGNPGNQFKITEYDENAIGQPTVEVSETGTNNAWYFTKTSSGWGITFRTAKEGTNREKSAMLSLVERFEQTPKFRKHYKSKNPIKYQIVDAESKGWSRFIDAHSLEQAEKMVEAMNKKAGRERYQVLGIGVDDR